MDQEKDKSIIYKNIQRYFENLHLHHIHCQKAYLYGSYAKGTFSPDSDIDLALVSANFSGDIIDDQVLLMKLRRTIDPRIEPYPFLPDEFTPDNPFVHEILETGEDVTHLLFK